MMNSMISEIWKPVEGYEGLYEVSNTGKVATLNYRHTGERRELSPKTERTGYMKVLLYKRGGRKLCSVHRLVAKAFIPNPNNLRCVNHIDENKSNNDVSNLEWCSHSYNNKYGSRIENVFTQLRRPVEAKTHDGVIEVYPSVTQAAKSLNKSASNISGAANGRLKTAYGRTWRYLDV